MRRALESLPWVRKATVNYEKKQASVTALADRIDEAALVKALRDAGFGGTVPKPDEGKPKARQPEGSLVAVHVTGMKKTKSGAT